MKPSNLRPFFAYLSESQYVLLKQFSQKTSVSMTKIIRESIDARLSSGDQYVSGYNQGLLDAVSMINRNNVSKMSFPSGKTFGEILTEDITAQLRNNDGSGTKQQAEAQQEEQGLPPNAGSAT